jgi:hypothetical protein
VSVEKHFIGLHTLPYLRIEALRNIYLPQSTPLGHELEAEWQSTQRRCFFLLRLCFVIFIHLIVEPLLQ